MAHEYPQFPVVGVGAVIVRDGQALIVRRGHEPRKGEWSLPGGRVELGESLIEAVRREMSEETGLEVAIGPMLETFDRVHRAADGRIRYHFVIIDYLCAPIGGVERAGDDAEALAWVRADEIDAYGVNAHAAALIRRALTIEWRR